MMAEKIVRTIEDQRWIDGAAVPVQSAVRSVLARAPGLARVLHGTWLGHPLHAALVAVPIGALACGFMFDMAEVAGKKRFRRAADVLESVGLAGALTAAVAGLADWSATRDGATRVGFVHATANVLIAGLTGGSLLARSKGKRRAGIALSSVALGLLFGSAWLGGELAYRLGVGVRRRGIEEAAKGQHEDFAQMEGAEAQ
jgi:uncharacterized membrane protein